MSKKKESFLESIEPEWLKKIDIPNWLIWCLTLVFILRIPSFFEPFYYGDEMIYLNLGHAARRGWVFYRDIHDNKPPLLYFTAMIAGNVFWFRAILTAWMMATTVAFYKLINGLFAKNKNIVKAGVFAFVILTTIPLLEGQIANAELFMIGPTIIAFHLLVNSKKLTNKRVFMAGLLLAVAALFKVPAIFDLGAIFFLWFLATKIKLKDLNGLFVKGFYLGLGIALPIAVSFIWYIARGAGSSYLTAAFLQNIGYLSSWRSPAVETTFLERNMPLIVRGLVLLSGVGVLTLFRNKLSKPFMLASVWLLFSLFAVLLSERPYPHYLIQAVPAISLLLGMLVASQKKEQTLTVIPLFVLLVAVVQVKFWHYPTIPYYNNFFKLATGQQTKAEYFSYFDKNLNLKYDLAEFLVSSSEKEDRVFIWGDSAPVYALSKRLPPVKYVATYHMIDFSSPEEVASQVSQQKPKFVIIMPESPPFPELYRYLRGNYIKIETIKGADIWKSTSPEVSLLLR